jgi:hypothetical protein
MATFLLSPFGASGWALEMVWLILGPSFTTSTSGFSIVAQAGKRYNAASNIKPIRVIILISFRGKSLFLVKHIFQVNLIIRARGDS